MVAIQTLAMETKGTTQKNLAINRGILKNFEEFCERRAMNEGRAASAAMLAFMDMDPVAREALFLRLDQVAGGKAKSAGEVGGSAKPKRKGDGASSEADAASKG